MVVAAPPSNVRQNVYDERDTRVAVRLACVLHRVQPQPADASVIPLTQTSLSDAHARTADRRSVHSSSCAQAHHSLPTTSTSWPSSLLSCPSLLIAFANTLDGCSSPRSPPPSMHARTVYPLMHAHAAHAVAPPAHAKRRRAVRAPLRRVASSIRRRRLRPCGRARHGVVIELFTACVSPLPSWSLSRCSSTRVCCRIGPRTSFGGCLVDFAP